MQEQRIKKGKLGEARFLPFWALSVIVISLSLSNCHAVLALAEHVCLPPFYRNDPSAFLRYPS
jgi:hypothetical protein